MARDKLQFRWDTMDRLMRGGIANLVREHWELVGWHKDVMPLDVDWSEYFELERRKIFYGLAVRLDGVLIGYNVFFCRRHMHYSGTMHALSDAIFVTKAHRSSGAGYQLIARAERELPDLVKEPRVRVIYHDKADLEYLGPTLARMGYMHSENIWEKMVSRGGHGDRSGHRSGGGGHRSR